MKTKILVLLLGLSSVTTFASRWKLARDVHFQGSKIRTGIKRAEGKLKGHILYLQGLGDSLLNHDPLFNRLNREGYSVIAFDYLGQGGSEGSMNSTTIKNINILADVVWKKYVPNRAEKKILLGWSTGGLAAYRYATYFPIRTRAIILLAPGIAPKVFIGETTVSSNRRNLKVLEITERTLTSYKHPSHSNPHVDGIRPNSPLKVPAFAANLLTTAKISDKWRISPSVKGIVFLSDDVDSYVDRSKTRRILELNAPHFEIVDFENTGALHELDNEAPEISKSLRESVSTFLKVPN